MPLVVPCQNSTEANYYHQNKSVSKMYEGAALLPFGPLARALCLRPLSYVQGSLVESRCPILS